MSIRILQPRIMLGDPHDCTDAADELCVQGAIYDTLMRREGTRFVPALAQAWTVADEGRTWRFSIRPGVVFHDGSPCDAKAVQASLERMAREDKGYTLGSPAVWRQYLGGANYQSNGLDLTVHLAEPMADFADVLVQGLIVAPSAFEALDKARRWHIAAPARTSWWRETTTAFRYPHPVSRTGRARATAS